MIKSIADFAPDGLEAGVGLALQDEAGRYVFFLAGTRHCCPPGELFYAGIGGHREAGEDWLTCAHREAREEVGVDIEILPAPVTWHVNRKGLVRQIEVQDQPRPFVLYEMIHPPSTPREGEMYRIVIYMAKLKDRPTHLSADEVQGILAMTGEQVIQGLERKTTVQELIREGAWLVAGEERIDPEVRLYPPWYGPGIGSNTM